jgi:hypothetical protein
MPGTEISVRTGAIWRIIQSAYVARVSLTLLSHVHAVVRGSVISTVRKKKAKQANH